MNLKYISWLQRIFLLVGCFILASYLLAMGAEVYRHFYLAGHSDFTPIKETSFFLLMQGLFRALGQAFFAFLMSAVFGMVFHRTPVRSERAERLMKVTCFGFFGEGLLGIVNWCFSFGRVLEFGSWADWLQWLVAASWALDLFPCLISFVYAGSIYVLFRHFSEMVAFESEVV